MDESKQQTTGKKAVSQLAEAGAESHSQGAANGVTGHTGDDTTNDGPVLLGHLALHLRDLFLDPLEPLARPCLVVAGDTRILPRPERAVAKERVIKSRDS